MKTAEKTILGLAAEGPQGPSFRVRCVEPSRAMREYGVKLRGSPLFTEREAREFSSGSAIKRARVLNSARRRLHRSLPQASADVDTVVICRQADLVPHMSLERKATAGARFVYDIDDALWVGGAETGGHRLSFLKASGRRVRWLSTRADHVVAGNEILAEYVSQFADEVTVVPSLVDPSAVAVRSHRDSDHIVLGWIGSFSTTRYLARLVPALTRLADAVKPRHLELVVVGGAPLSIPGVAGTFLPWTEENEARALGRMDVGVMPLPDNAWTRGKCAYKSLQYMAAGIPVVADDVGVAGSTIGEGGFVVRHESEWPDALEELATSADLRRTLGARGRERTEREYSVERWAGTLAQIWTGSSVSGSQGDSN